jgi:hypothetical protein
MHYYTLGQVRKIILKSDLKNKSIDDFLNWMHGQTTLLVNLRCEDLSTDHTETLYSAVDMARYLSQLPIID